MNFAHLLQSLSAEPWFISEVDHALLLSRHCRSLEFLVGPEAPITEADLAKAMGLAFAQRPAATIDQTTGLAEIHLFGAVARNLAPLQRATGMTDFAQLHSDFSAALGAGARGILLHVDSPGGTVSGTPEAAALVANSPVPVVAHLARAGSAAYYIAAGARRLIASPSGDVGSIGVIMPRVDLSGALEKLGIKQDTITNTAGDLKNISSTGALTEAQRTYLQSEADGMFAAFRDHILAHRLVPASAMRGQTLSGSAALAANLCDELGSAATARAHLLAML